MEELTAEEMDREAGVFADDMNAIALALLTPGLNPVDVITEIFGRSLKTYGDVQAGLDKNANRTRFLLQSGGKGMDKLAVSLLPLTNSE